MASIFTRIIDGELPAYRIYENDLVIAILALDQVTPGHTLVIPKKEQDHWFEVDEESFLAVQKASRKIAAAMKSALGCPRVITTTIGFEVHHYHQHLIPATGISDLNFSKAKRLSGLEMEKMRAAIRQHLSA